MASRKERSAAGGELRDVFTGARENPTAGLAGALIGATDAAGAVTGLGERGVAAARAGGSELVSRIGPAADAVHSSVSNLRENPPDWDQVMSTLADTAGALRTSADAARTTAWELATGPVGQAVRDRAAELAMTGLDLAQEKGAVARHVAEKRSREAAHKLNKSVNKTVNKTAAAATVAKVRKDLEPRLTEFGELAGDVSQRAAEIAVAASAAALARLNEKERREQARRRWRKITILLIGAAAVAAAAAQLRRNSDAASAPAASVFGVSGPGTSGPGTSGPGTSGPGTSGPGTSGPGTSGPGTSGPVATAGAPIDPVPDAAAAQVSPPEADDLPPATSADGNGQLEG
jgi:hypothetical protein